MHGQGTRDTDTDSGSGTNYASFWRQSRTGDLNVELKKNEVGSGEQGAGRRRGHACKRKLRRPERTSRAKRAPTLKSNDTNADPTSGRAVAGGRG